MSKRTSGSLLIAYVTPPENIVRVTHGGDEMQQVAPGVYVARDEKGCVDITWTPREGGPGA